jgi:hypothetical protein
LSVVGDAANDEDDVAANPHNGGEDASSESEEEGEDGEEEGAESDAIPAVRLHIRLLFSGQKINLIERHLNNPHCGTECYSYQR